MLGHGHCAGGGGGSLGSGQRDIPSFWQAALLL